MAVSHQCQKMTFIIILFLGKKEKLQSAFGLCVFLLHNCSLQPPSPSITIFQIQLYVHEPLLAKLSPTTTVLFASAKPFNAKGIQTINLNKLLLTCGEKNGVYSTNASPSSSLPLSWQPFIFRVLKWNINQLQAICFPFSSWNYLTAMATVNN